MLSSSVPTIIATVGGDENIVLKMSLNCNNYKKRKEKKKSDKHVIELMYWLVRIYIFLDGLILFSSHNQDSSFDNILEKTFKQGDFEDK